MFIVACWLTAAAVAVVVGLNLVYAVRYWLSLALGFLARLTEHGASR